MARTQAADYEAQRTQILDAAAEVFAATSYPAATMADVASALDTSKARLYHYYESKEAILFDLLERHTARLVSLTEQTQDLAQLIRLFLAEYQTSVTRHIALLNDVKFLSDVNRDIILDRERAVVSAFASALQRAYPHLPASDITPKTMMIFGMINWTFTWLKADGKLSYGHYAEQVIATLQGGLAQS